MTSESKTLTIYTGYDPREALGTWVWQHSVLKRVSCPVSFMVLDKRTIGSLFTNLFQLAASNQFVYSRFASAALSEYHGPPVVFADGADMVAQADLCQMVAEHDTHKAISVVKRQDYVPTPNKYVGTDMQAKNKAYHRKQWSSVMVIQPGHFAWRRIDWNNPDKVYWQEFGWLHDAEIGELSPEWNSIVDEGDPVDKAKILHFTLGVPAMNAYKDSPGADIWRTEAREALHICDPIWKDKLGHIVS